MGSIIGYQETHGPVATFETDVARKIKKLEASIEPIQDLHGYDSPWPAGGGKNKLQVTATSQTVNDVTFTVNNDGTITANGTATANIVFTIAYIDFASGSYLLNGTPSGGSTSTYFIRVYNSNTQTSINSTTSDASFTAEGGFNRVDIRVLNGVTVNNLVFKPMIRLESETDATFAPYSNICPITGWTGAKVSRTGINLWDEEWEVGAINVDTGENMAIQSRIRTKNFIPVKPGMSVFIVSPNQGSGSTAGNLQGRYYNKDKQYLGSNPMMKVGQAITIPNDCYYVRFGTQSIYGSSYSHDISINYPSTDMQYHAYQGDTYDITFPSAAGTVYGGTLDVVKGTLTLTHKGGYFTDLYSSGLNAWTTNMSGVSRWGLPKSMFDGMANAVSNHQPDDFLCSAYKTISAANTLARINGVGVTESGLVVIFDENYSDSATISNSGAVAYFSSINPFFVWKLANPITYQLTPQEVRTIIGTNTIYADTGDTSVIYPKTITPIETMSNVNLMELRRSIITSQPHLETKTGAIVAFKSTMTKESKNWVVDINPVQEGTGDPSPDNIRPITGWTGAKVARCGKNLWNGEYLAEYVFDDYNATLRLAPDYIITEYIPVVPGVIYYKSNTGTARALFFDRNYNVINIGKWPISGNATVFTVPDNAEYVRFSIYSQYWSDFIMNLSVDKNGEYEPYVGSTYNITFPAEADTVYGGTLDVVKGTLTLTHKGGFFNNLYSSGLNAMTTNASDVRRWGLPKSMFDGIANAVSNNQPEDFLCSAYKTISAANTLGRNNGISVTESGLVVIFDENYSDKATTSNGGAVTYFSNINPFFVWKLDTPITYQLTPQEIALLSGNNTIYADCGDTTISYFTN